MSVIPITIFFSLLLAGTFVLLFAREQRRRGLVSAERDSLLPLADEQGRLVEQNEVERGRRTRSAHPAPAGPRSTHHQDDDDHDHDHADGACGCRDGSRPPCTGCLKRPDRSAPPAPPS